MDLWQGLCYLRGHTLGVGFSPSKTAFVITLRLKHCT